MEIYVSTISSAKRDYPESQYEAHLCTGVEHKEGNKASRDSPSLCAAGAARYAPPPPPRVGPSPAVRLRPQIMSPLLAACGSDTDNRPAICPASAVGAAAADAMDRRWWAHARCAVGRQVAAAADGSQPPTEARQRRQRGPPAAVTGPEQVPRSDTAWTLRRQWRRCRAPARCQSASARWPSIRGDLLMTPASAGGEVRVSSGGVSTGSP